jgi:hypothetical protein
MNHLISCCSHFRYHVGMMHEMAGNKCFPSSNSGTGQKRKIVNKMKLWKAASAKTIGLTAIKGLYTGKLTRVRTTHVKWHPLHRDGTIRRCEKLLVTFVI